MLYYGRMNTIGILTLLSLTLLQATNALPPDPWRGPDHLYFVASNYRDPYIPRPWARDFVNQLQDLHFASVSITLPAHPPKTTQRTTSTIPYVPQSVSH